MTTATIEALVADPAFVEDPYPTYEQMIAEGPVWTTPEGEKVFCRYDDVNVVLRDPARFGQAVKQHKHPSFVMLDPPDHTRLRGLVSKAFTPRAIGRMQADIRAASDELLEHVRSVGRMELVRDYARPLPTRMITDMLGIPLDDADRWEAWANAIHRSTAAISFLADQKAVADQLRVASVAASELETDYFAELIAQRKARPPQDDVLGALIQVEEQGDRLTDLELRYTLVLLLGAGHHTSVNLIANGTWVLLEHPDQLDELRANRELLPNAIEEMIRWDGIVQITRRRVTEDTTIAGVPLRAGEVITLVLGAANRDPELFEDPARFDIRRENVHRHLGFGFGVHHCLGAALARAEAMVAFDALLGLPGLRLAEPGPFPHGAGYGLRGIERLPVAWDI